MVNHNQLRQHGGTPLVVESRSGESEYYNSDIAVGEFQCMKSVFFVKGFVLRHIVKIQLKYQGEF